MSDAAPRTAAPVERASNRLVSVQILRGIAALLVVWRHLNVAVAEVRTDAGPSAIGGFARTFQFGSIGVDLFFLISGFVMAFTMQQYLGKPLPFIRQRYLRVAPLAYLIAATWIGILLALGLPVPLESVLPCITFLPLLPHYTEPMLPLLWTLSFEFTFYLLVMAALALRLGPRQLLWITATLGTAGFVWTLPIALLRWFTHPMLLEFALGIAAFLVWRSAHLSRTAVIGLGVFAGCLLLAGALLGVPIETNPSLTVAGPMAGPRLFLWALPGFFVLLALLHWSPGNGRAVLIGQRLGDASYSIYLTHLIPVRLAAYLLPLPGDARWLAGFAAAVAAGLLVHRHVERPLLALMIKPQASPPPALQPASA